MLDRWIRASEEAASQLEAETGKKSGGPTGFCHRLFVATFGTGVPPHADRGGGDQGIIANAFGVRTGVLPGTDTPDPVDALRDHLRGDSPIAVDGFPPGERGELHIAAAYKDSDGKVHIFDSKVSGGHTVVADEKGLREWLGRSFDPATVIFHRVETDEP